MRRLLLFGLLAAPFQLVALDSTFDGFIRTGYYQELKNGTFLNDAFAVGGKVGAKAALGRYFDLNFGLLGSERMTPAASSSVSGGFFDSNSKSFWMLGEASVAGEYQYHDLVLGRQQIDTPHADSDDIRMVMNLFEAYRYDYSGFEHIAFGVTHFTHMVGWENGGDVKLFVNIHDVMGITDPAGKTLNGGMTMAHWDYEGEHFYFAAYDYYLYDAYNTVYLETGFSTDHQARIYFDFAMQYSANFGDTSYLNQGTLQQSIDAQLVGVTCRLGFTAIGTEVALAANYGFGKDAVMGSWGGGPYFTSMENMTFDAIGDSNARAYLGSVSQGVGKHFSLSYAYGLFQAADTALQNIAEQNFAISYTVAKAVKVNVVYAVVEDRATAANSYDFFYTFLELPLVY